MSLISIANAQAAGGAQSGGTFNIILIVGMVVIFYFLLIRPQQKRQKEHQQMLTRLAAGDEVVTAGGIVSRVVEVGESLIVVSHGGVIRSVLNVVDPTTTHGAITNGSVHSFELVDGALELIAFDDPIDELSLQYGTDDLDEQNALENRDTIRG